MKHKSLIKNEPMEVQMIWDLDGMEVDLLAKAITGKKRVISSEKIQTFVQGLVEGLLAAQLESNEDYRLRMESSLRSNGKSEEYIQSYLRGWDSVGKSILDGAQI